MINVQINHEILHNVGYFRKKKISQEYHSFWKSVSVTDLSDVT